MSVTRRTLLSAGAAIGTLLVIRPARGPSRHVITSRCGFFSFSTVIASTWSAALIGLATCTVIGTVLPLSLIHI